jgi:hypothetical protein
VASGAYPLGVDPQTLRDYSDTASAPCNGWPKESDCESFVHLSDGGVHDNLAVSELQWFIECTFKDKLDTRPRIGTNTMLCPSRPGPSTKPGHVLSIVIDASLTASTGRDNQKGEDRLARSGFPIRVLSTARTIDMMSFANATQRKTEFSALASELKSLGIGSGFVDFGLEGLNDPDCFERNECNTWEDAQTFSSAHGIPIARSVTNESMRDFFTKVTDAGFTSLNRDEVLILTEAAHWIVARRVLELCRNGTIRGMFPDSDEDHAAVCKGAENG